MCRVIIRPQTRVLGGLVPTEAPSQLGELLTDMTPAGLLQTKAEPMDDGMGLMNVSEEFNLQDSDADLLAMFHELSEETPAAPAAPAAPLPRAPVQNLFEAVPPAAPAPVMQSGAQPLNLFEQQMMFQQAIMAQQVQQQQQLNLAQLAAKPACYSGLRRGKSPEEIAVQIERTKQRRRESAHRSRSRRKDYMKHLEDENEELKAEIAALRAQLKAQGVAPPPVTLRSVAASAGDALNGEHDSGSSTSEAHGSIA